jgi:4-amino-4-deoxy-L-arabinose transferase-like glycosyltransferase
VASSLREAAAGHEHNLPRPEQDVVRERRRVVAGGLLWALALGLLFFYLLVFAAHAANLAGYPYDLDQGEAYDLNSGWLLAQGRPIYTDNQQFPYYSSNYPPVFSYILSLVVAQTGPTLAAGRLLSAAAAGLAAVLVGAVVARMSQSGPAALTVGLLFLASPYVFHTTPLARVNALALLFALVGLACCLGRGWAWTAGAVVAFVLALFTKQTTADAVGAGLLALLLRDVRVGVVAGLVVAFIGAVGLLLLDTVHHGAFWTNVVVGNVNPFDPKQAIDYYRNFLELHLIVVALAGWQVVRAVRERRIGPFELYWLASLVLAVSVGKWGAGESYFLAPIAASVVLAGQRIGELHRASELRPTLLAAIGGLLLVQGLLFSHGPLNRLGPLFVDRGAQASVLSRFPGQREIDAAADLVALLKRADGPVLLEDPSYGLAIGKEVVGNATHLRNLYQAGAWSPDPLVDDLRERRYAWVVLDAELYPEPVLAAIGRYYYLYEEYEINGTKQQVFAPGAE